MRSELLLVAGCAALLAGCSTPRPEATEAASPGPLTQAGEIDAGALPATDSARRCLSSRPTSSTVSASGGRFVMVRQSVNDWYRNELRETCPALNGRNRVTVFRSPSANMCEGDSFDVVDSFSRMYMGTCILGPFTPVNVPNGAKFAGSYR